MSVEPWDIIWKVIIYWRWDLWARCHSVDAICLRWQPCTENIMGCHSTPFKDLTTTDPTLVSIDTRMSIDFEKEMAYWEGSVSCRHLLRVFFKSFVWRHQFWYQMTLWGAILHSRNVNCFTLTGTLTPLGAFTDAILRWSSSRWEGRTPP